MLSTIEATWLSGYRKKRLAAGFQRAPSWIEAEACSAGERSRIEAIDGGTSTVPDRDAQTETNSVHNCKSRCTHPQPCVRSPLRELPVAVE